MGNITLKRTETLHAESEKYHPILLVLLNTNGPVQYSHVRRSRCTDEKGSVMLLSSRVTSSRLL